MKTEQLNLDERIAIWKAKQQGTEIAAKEKANGKGSHEDVLSWPIPKPLPEGLLPVPTLPEIILPESLRPWLADIASRLQVPLDFPAAPAIVALGSIIGNQMRVRPKRRDDWTVTPNLWGATIGRPGVLKSPAIAEALRPLRKLEEKATKSYKEAVTAWKFDKEAGEVKKTALREQMKKSAKGGSNLEEYRSKLEEAEEELEEPIERRYLVNDSTVAKYGELLNQNSNGLLIFRDELTGWLRSLDDESHMNDRAFYLEAWEARGDYTYDRIGRGTLHIKSITTSVFGSIQPGPLQSYLRAALSQGVGDDGLIQRFQMAVFPDLSADEIYIDRWPDTKARETAFQVFEKLNAIPDFPLQGRDPDLPPYLHLDDEAQELFSEWYTDLCHNLKTGAFGHPALESHFSKYRSLMPSLALIFELADQAAKGFAGFTDSISYKSVEIAAAWCSFLMAHARRIYGLGVSDTAIRARALAKHLQQGHLPKVFRGPILYNKQWSGLDTAEAVREPLELLEALGWLQGFQVATGGRPTVEYTINPRISEVAL
jgi:uncharacterized protein DUF3987